MKNSFSSIVTKIGAVSTGAYIATFGMVGDVFAQTPTPGISDRVRAAGGAQDGSLAPGTKDVAGEIFLKKGFAENIGSLITSLLTFVMLIAALLILMYLIWGGIQWITSGGDKGKTEEARNKITSAVIGLIILAAAWAVFLIILKFLGFDSYNDLFENITSISG